MPGFDRRRDIAAIMITLCTPPPEICFEDDMLLILLLQMVYNHSAQQECRFREEALTGEVGMCVGCLYTIPRNFLLLLEKLFHRLKM